MSGLAYPVLADSVWGDGTLVKGEVERDTVAQMLVFSVEAIDRKVSALR